MNPQVGEPNSVNSAHTRGKMIRYGCDRKIYARWCECLLQQERKKAAALEKALSSAEDARVAAHEAVAEKTEAKKAAKQQEEVAEAAEEKAIANDSEIVDLSDLYTLFPIY